MKNIEITLEDKMYETLEEISESCHLSIEEVFQIFAEELVTDQPGKYRQERKLLLIRWLLSIYYTRSR